MKPTETQAWQTLTKHYQKISLFHMRDLFQQDSKRFQTFSLQAPYIFVDYSKNRITQETLQLLFELANTMNLPEKIENMFSGKPINTTEHRAALHTALRDQSNQPIIIDGINIKTEIAQTLQKMRQFVSDVHEKRFLGFTNQPITDVVNIGIGGSDLGPKMVCHALSAYSTGNLRCHFVSNIDSTNIVETLKPLNPETTLFCVASKTFTTIETLTNAETAKKWLLKILHQEKAIEKHFVAISANIDKAKSFGISQNNIFEFWDWVGGRYSVWSAIGLPIALLIGMDQFEEFLKGAYAIDEHFRTSPFEQNAPVILALLDIWYRNFFNTTSQAIIPYDQYLQFLPAYVEQLNMESNGKSVDTNGSPVDYSTAPVIWGGIGTDSQHAFHQMLHQGIDLIPIDFIIELNSLNPVKQHHELLFANCIAQSQVLLQGKTLKEAHQELIEKGYSENNAQLLAPHKTMPGNRPSHTFILETLTPFSLGALIALYEHRTFVQGAIWNINSFDQWGVELGKQLANKIVPDLTQMRDIEQYDSSTQGLIKLYRNSNL